MDVELLDPLGARVTGLRLADVGDREAEALRRLLADRGFVVLPGQEDAGDPEFVAFLRRFGPMAFTTGEAPAPGAPDLNAVSNVGRTTPPKSTWHVDTSYVREPPAYTALRAVVIPASGGETLFSDQQRAYDTLPPDVRDRLEGRSIRHVATGVELDEGDEAEAWHPILRPHPLTGRLGLYLTTPKRCAEVSGATPAETERIVGYLFAHSTGSANVHAHAWAPGDVVMWDNARVLHRADHSAVDGDRVLHRGMVATHRGPGA